MADKEITTPVPDVSVVVVSWNTRQMLHDCLESIFHRTASVNFEVIVVDNASEDGSGDMVKCDFPDVVLIRNSENTGFAAANNQGIKAASGRYILLLNSDTIIIGDAIRKTVDFADANPGAAVVGCRVLNSDRTVQQTCFMFPSLLNMILSSTFLYKLFPKSRFFGRERMTWWDRNDVREVEVVSGCFMLLNRQAIEQVGAMDESFFMYAEETDLCYRFKKAGWRILFTPGAQIIHYGGQSSKQKAVEMSLQLRSSILVFFKKHRSGVEYRLACVLTWLFFVIRIPPWFLVWLISRKKRELSALRLKVYLFGVWKLMLRGPQSLCYKRQ